MVNYGKHYCTILVYWLVDNEVHVDHFSWLLWDWKGLIESSWFLRVNLRPLIFHTLFAILLNILTHLLPPEPVLCTSARFFSGQKILTYYASSLNTFVYLCIQRLLTSLETSTAVLVVLPKKVKSLCPCSA